MHNVYIHNFQFNVTQIACNRLITSVLIQQTAQSIIMICHLGPSYIVIIRGVYKKDIQVQQILLKMYMCRL